MFMGSRLDVKAVLRIAFSAKKSAQKKAEKKQFMIRKVQKASINNSAQIINHDVI